MFFFLCCIQAIGDFSRNKSYLWLVAIFVDGVLCFVACCSMSLICTLCLCCDRYDLDTGEYDGMQFSTSLRIDNVAFNGQDACVSSGSSTIRCYQILTNNIYDMPVRHKAELVEGSRLLNNEMNQMLSQELPSRFFALCYSGEVHGFSASTFHSRCDNKGPTVTIARVSSGSGTGRIIGGYAPVAWTSARSYHRAHHAFLYKFEGNQMHRTDPSLSRPQSAIYDRSNYCPTFGESL